MDSKQRAPTRSKRPTLQDIAEAANVSLMTVSRALSQNGSVAPKTRERILKEVERLGYRPSFSARSLRQGESRLIGFLSADTLIPLHVEIVQGARDSAADRGYRLVLQMDHLRNPLENPFTSDGDLIIDTRNVPILDRYRYVSVMVMNPDLDSVGTDLPAVTRDAFLYLYAQGYRKIGFIQTVHNTPLEGRIQALKHLGVQDDPALIEIVTVEQRSVAEGVRKLLARNPDMDGLMVAHSVGTPVAFAELIRQGVDIGNNFAFIGTEVSQNQWSSIVTPRMSTIRIPAYEIGVTGIKLLIDRLQGSDAPPQHISLATELVIRQSTSTKYS